MSHPTTSTDFDKYGTFKITTSNAVKRASNESHSHDDDSKKLRLEKSGSSSNVLSSGTGSATNSVSMGSTVDSSVAKKLKTRKIVSDGSTVQQYHLIVEDSAGALSEESSCGITGGFSESSTKTYATSSGGEEMVLIRKQMAAKSSDSNDVGVEERIIHIEGDPGGTTNTSYLTTVSTKAPQKRLQLGMVENKKSLCENIDLKLIPASSDGLSTGKFSLLSAGDKKPEQQILLTASSSAINSQNTFTYSRVCSVGSVSSSSGDSVNIKGLQGTVKNQSLMVSSKKLLPEVTQTTAKVSIGNTTISVPLLKPLNSSQIIQAGSSATSQAGSSDGTKSVIHTIQGSSSHSPQTQLSKILNIKRGQKVTQPTFVSLSQLQIKPVPSAKIVQAKVLSKKIPLHIQAVQTNKSTLLQQTSGVVTITSSKADLAGQQGHIMPSPQKKQQLNFIKELPPGAVVKSTANTNCEEFGSSALQTSSALTASETVSGTAVLSSDKSQIGKSSSGSSENPGPSIISTEFLPAGVKVVHSSTSPHINNATLRQSLAHQVENADQSQIQPQRISICPTISIVRQNSPQLVTSTGNMSTVSLSMADTVSGQQKLVLTKSQFANVSSSSMSTSGANTVTANFPRNISLMLAKNAAGQQVFTNAGGKTTLCVTTSANSSINKAGARMNLSISSNVLTSSSSSSTNTVLTSGHPTERDATVSATEIAASGSETTLQAQSSNQHLQSSVVPSRKIIQVLPGSLYSSSGGSFLQITKTKVDTEDDKRKMGETEHSSGQQQQTVHQQIQIQQIQQQQQPSQQQQQQQIHLQIQQGQGTHQSQQQQQQKQQQQMQVQPQQQHQPQHIQIQQIQTQMPQTQQQQRQQLLQQQRQQFLHKHQLHQQLQKQQQQHMQQQQQLQHQSSLNQETTTSTDSNQCQTTFATSTPTTAPHSTTDTISQQLHPGSGVPSHPPPKPEESNNVLLKQLLQNSNSTPVNNQSSGQNARINSVSATASAALPSRKVINVRAPSLGLVSSLEAQLARPVIPPVPASESTTQSTSTSTSTQSQTSSSISTLPPAPSAPMPQSTKMTLDSVKVVSAVQSGLTSAPTASLSTSTTSAPSLIISTTKSHSLSGVSDKSKFGSPLISKETSFVSKPTLPEPPEQKIEIFSLQSSSGDNTSKSDQQQQFERLTPTTPGHQQLVNAPIKSFSTTTHNSTGQTGSSITTKITKYVPEAKKAGEHQQQQQQHLTITRTYNSGGSTNGGNNIIGNAKEKTGAANMSATAHPSSQVTAPVQNVSQQQHQLMASGMHQSNLQDSNNQAKATEGSTSSVQQMHQLSSNPVHMTQMAQQQQLMQSVATKIDATTVKSEPEESNNSVHPAQLHLNQMQQQQQQQQTAFSRQNSTAPSPMSTTPTNSVPSTPTTECQTPINIINKQMHQQHTPVSSNQTPQTSAASAPSSGSKEGDQRKKRKRDQPKQPKKHPANTKETAATTASCSANAALAANNKKRSRKSLKLEEDYDTFIDNLMLHLRQMPPMQVLEPKLNVNYGVCNLYGWRNWTRPSNNISSNSPPKESRQNERANLFENELVGEFGSAYLPNKVPLYDLVPLGDPKSRSESNCSSSMQNNYYDQEFKSFTYKTEAEKLTSWCKIYRERAVDTSEVVSNKLMLPIDPVKTMRLNMLQQETFPGLILMSSTQQKLGRMSPVIPIVNPMALITKRKKTPLKQLDNDTVQHAVYIKEQTDDIDCKLGLKPNASNQNVILSLPASSADRLLDVLKNLANLLQINAPIPYKVVEDADSETEQKPTTMSENEREMALKFIAIQDILNGRSKMCRHCGKAIKGRCIKNNEQCTKSPMLAKLRGPLPPRYFCNKICYIQFRWGIERKLTGSASLKSVITSKEGPQNQDYLMADDLDVKPDLKVLEESPKVNLASEVEPVEPVAKTKKVCFRYYNSKCFQPSTPVKRMSEREIRDMLFRMDITMSASTPHNLLSEPGASQQQLIEDRRTCVLCSHVGDGVADGPSRLLNYDVDKWVHLNCALWSTDVYETISGGLMNFQMALQMGLNQTCVTCQQLGATVKCYKTRCGAVFHLPCAIRDQCVFYQNKTIHCHAHASRNEKDKELLTLSVPRRVYVERDENRQVAAIMHHSEMVNLLRVGSLIFLNVGQLLPHQLEAFHTPNYIYPIGYKMIRFYWSMRHPNKRCRYICSIAEVAGKPEFRIVVQEPSESDVDLRDSSPKAVWQRVLQPIAEMRKAHNLVKLYPEFISGEDLFGLTEPTIVRIIESLPGVETLTNYRFKYGRNPLLDLPLALNPSGAARTEPKLRQIMGWKKHHPQRTCSSISSVGGGGHQGSMTSVAAAGEVTCPYSKQFVHSKSSQYKKMKQEWRNNVYLARSKIQGLGLYAARDLEKHTMIIEYIGEVIRTEVSEIREKQYEARNRGIYMFRLDEDRVVDATLSGGLARYINHSCNPNCVTEIVEVDRELRIIIFAKRRINRSEELSYDYKFDIEDDGSKIPCMCGAPNCRKWMN